MFLIRFYIVGSASPWKHRVRSCGRCLAAPVFWMFALFNPVPFVRVFSRSAHNKTIGSNFRLKTTLKTASHVRLWGPDAHFRSVITSALRALADCLGFIHGTARRIRTYCFKYRSVAQAGFSGGIDREGPLPMPSLFSRHASFAPFLPQTNWE